MNKFVAIAAVAAVSCAAQAIIVMDFETIPGDVQPVNNYYAGVTFGSSSTGSPLVTRRASTGNYNLSSTNGTSYGSGEYWINNDVGVTSALDGSGNDGRISFNNQDATFVSLSYCCSSTFFFEAYRANGSMITSTSGAANLRYINGNAMGPGSLTVSSTSADPIAYVIVHDTGNFWVIDSVITDATGVTPAPGAAAVLGMGALLVGRRRR
jgi:uncharacterized protein (TIGR03382 family)